MAVNWLIPRSIRDLIFFLFVDGWHPGRGSLPWTNHRDTIIAQDTHDIIHYVIIKRFNRPLSSTLKYQSHLILIYNVPHPGARANNPSHFHICLLFVFYFLFLSLSLFLGRLMIMNVSVTFLASLLLSAWLDCGLITAPLLIASSSEPRWNKTKKKN